MYKGPMAVAAGSAVQPPAMHYFTLSGHQLKSSRAETGQMVGLDPCYVCSTYSTKGTAVLMAAYDGPAASTNSR